MTNTADYTYTPLECLLLFQSLVTYGVEDEDFHRISDLVTNNLIVKDGPTYDSQRLTADALRGLYLRLVREELDAAGLDGEDGSLSKKRKIPSLKDAHEHRDQLPVLVDRLYARYREYMIRAIREDEKRYAIIQREIAEIERGEWDQRILEEQRPRINGTYSPTDSHSIPNGSAAKLHDTPRSNVPTKVDREPTAPQQVISPRTGAHPEGLAISDVLNSQEQPPSVRPTEQYRAPPPNYPQLQHNPTSNGPHGPSPLQIQQHPNWQWETPFVAPRPPQPQQSPYNAGQYPPQYSQYNQQQFQPPRGSFSGPHGLPPPHPHVPSSPVSQQHAIHLPPPNGIHRPTSSPSMPLDALADVAGQQYRPSSGSPMMQHPPINYSPAFSPHQRSPSGGHPPNNGLPQAPSQVTPSYAPQHYQYPPGSRVPFVAPQTTIPMPGETRPYSTPYPPNQGPGPRRHSQLVSGRQSNPHTPLKRFPTITTGSGTRWTQTPTASTPRQHVSMESPAMEPLSPVLRPAKVVSAKRPESKKTDVNSKGNAPRASSPHSSIVEDPNMSQSAMSHADEPPVDADTSIHHVKEEVATPMGVEDAGDTTADEQPRLPESVFSPRRVTKRKRVSSIPDIRQPSTPPTHVLWTRAFPKISSSALESIAGHRNASTFAKPVNERDAPGYKTLILRPQDLKSIRSAITAGHRAASAAAPAEDSSSTSVWLPISEDLIPPKGIINYAQLEKELMRMFANAVMFNADPDRGLGRRFATGKDSGDSLGYLIDEDGMVKETRAMFADVEKIISSLRSAERRSEEMRENSTARGTAEPEDVDELAGDEASHVGNTGTSKRRRKG